MRSFIVFVFCLSVFYVGINTLVSEVKATFVSDEKAMELIKKSREAIGGDANIEAVKGMTIVGEADHHFVTEGTHDIKKGALEINFKLPNLFSKLVKIGEPGEGKHKTIELILGDDAEHSSDHDVMVEDGRIIIKKKDGSIEEYKTDGKNNVFIHEKGEGDSKTWTTKDGNKIVIEKRVGDDSKKDGDKTRTHWKTEGGNEIVIEEIEKGDMHFGHKMDGNAGEFLRTIVSLLRTTPGETAVNYKYLGVGDVDKKPSNIVEVESKGSTFKLFLDPSTNLLQMISYKAREHNLHFIHKDKMGNISKEKIVKMKKDMSRKSKDGDEAEYQIRFSDFRKVGNLLLPHSWSQTVNGKKNRETKITRFDINPANIDAKFKKRARFKSSKKKKKIKK